MSEWKDISTAPKDGRRVLIYTSGVLPRVTVGFWQADIGRKTPRPFWNSEAAQLHGVGWARASSPTHWMDLPPPPAPKGEGG